MGAGVGSWELGEGEREEEEMTYTTNVWVGNEGNADDRLKLAVSARDRERIDALPKSTRVHVRVKDLNTGKRYTLRRAKCGLQCMCALAVVGRTR